MYPRETIKMDLMETIHVFSAMTLPEIWVFLGNFFIYTAPATKIWILSLSNKSNILQMSVANE